MINNYHIIIWFSKHEKPTCSITRHDHESSRDQSVICNDLIISNSWNMKSQHASKEN